MELIENIWVTKSFHHVKLVVLLIVRNSIFSIFLFFLMAIRHTLVHSPYTKLINYYILTCFKHQVTIFMRTAKQFFRRWSVFDWSKCWGGNSVIECSHSFHQKFQVFQVILFFKYFQIMMFPQTLCTKQHFTLSNIWK